ncbi:SHOCT domain-containing protein [Geodermatophilus sp. SYSU D00684]
MGWYGWDHMSGWGWFTLTASAVLLIAVVVGLFRALMRTGGQPPPAPPRPTAEELLAERLARGEIGEDEYRSRLAALRGSSSAPRTPG